MSEHVKEAMNLLNSAISDQVMESPVGLEASKAMTERAQVLATLAVVEQLRIANLFRLREEVDSGTWALFYDANAEVEGKGVSLVLRPEIARALGLEVGS